MRISPTTPLPIHSQPPQPTTPPSRWARFFKVASAVLATVGLTALAAKTLGFFPTADKEDGNAETALAPLSPPSPGADALSVSLGFDRGLTREIVPIGSTTALNEAAYPVGGGQTLSTTSLPDESPISTNGAPSVNAAFEISTIRACDRIAPTHSAILANNKVAIGWQDGCWPNDWRVKFQLFDFFGLKVGPEHSINVSGAGPVYLIPLSNGNLIINTGSKFRIFNQNGTPISEWVEIYISTGSLSLREITPLQDGFLVFLDNTRGDPGVYPDSYGVSGVKFDLNGNPVGPLFRVNIHISGMQSGTAARTFSNGSVLAVWKSALRSSTVISGRRFTARGLQDGDEFIVSTTPAGEPSYPSTSTLSDGNILVVWVNNEGIKGQIIGQIGQKIDEEITFLAKPCCTHFFNPKAIGLSDGSILLFWTEQSNSDPILIEKQQRFASNTRALGPATVTDVYHGIALPDSLAFTVWSSNTRILGKISKQSNAPYVFSPIPPQMIPAGLAFQYTVPSHTFFSPYYSTTYYATLENNSKLPDWLQFNNLTLTFSGTPPIAPNSDLSVRLNAHNVDGTSSTSFTLALRLPPLVLNTAPIVLQSGEPFSFTLPPNAVTDPVFQNVSFAASPPPSLPWLSFDPHSLTFSGLPPAGLIGRLDVPVHASEPFGRSLDFTLTFPFNTPPIVRTSLPDVWLDLGKPNTLSTPLAPFFLDPDNNPLTFSLRSDPNVPLPPALDIQNSNLVSSAVIPSAALLRHPFFIVASDPSGKQAALRTFIRFQQQIPSPFPPITLTELRPFQFPFNLSFLASTNSSFSASLGPAGALPLGLTWLNSSLLANLPRLNSTTPILLQINADSELVHRRYAALQLRFNRLPRFLSLPPNFDAFLGQFFEAALNQSLAFDPDADPISFSIPNLPAWLSFNASALHLFGNVPANHSEPLDLELIVDDSNGGSLSSTFRIHFSTYPFLWEGITIGGTLLLLLSIASAVLIKKRAAIRAHFAKNKQIDSEISIAKKQLAALQHAVLALPPTKNTHIPNKAKATLNEL